MFPPMLRICVALLGTLVAFFAATVLLERGAHAADLSGAPMCDERAASAYADDPAPQPVDGGEVDAAPDAPCKAHLSASATVPSSRDDLSRTPEVPHDSNALLVVAVHVAPSVEAAHSPRIGAIGRPTDEHRRNDNPPPKPIPWRS